MTCNAHFRTWLSYSRQKSSLQIWFGLVEPFKSYRVHKHFSMPQTPPIGGGGSHLNYDAHFWTRMSYSSQNSCVEIWFGLVEIGGMLILRGAEDSLLGGGYMWPAMPIFELDRGYLDKSHVWKFGSDWLRLSRVIVRKNQMIRGRGQKFLK